MIDLVQDSFIIGPGLCSNRALQDFLQINSCSRFVIDSTRHIDSFVKDLLIVEIVLSAGSHTLTSAAVFTHSSLSILSLITKYDMKA